MRRRRRRSAARRERAPDWVRIWANQMTTHRLPPHVREYQGIEGRRFRFDFAWPTLKVAAECEGGIWAGRRGAKTGAGRHALPGGFSRDVEKYNLATIQGWRVIRATTTQIRDGEAIRWLAAALGRDLQEPRV